MEDHADRVQDVSRQVMQRGDRRITIMKSTNSHTPRDTTYKQQLHPVDVSRLSSILSLDTTNMTVHAEAQVTMDELVTYCLEQHSCVPRVCPEFRSFTVAGLINGRGIQTSSHRFALFEANVVEAELVLGNGDVVVVDEKHELMEGIRGSYGTLGLVVAAKMRVMRARQYVRCVYRVFNDVDEFCAFMTTQLGKPTYLDGVVYSLQHCVAIVGEFADNPDNDPVFHPLYPAEPGGEWYYQHIRNVRDRDIECIPTKEYIHRSERGAWWMVECYVNLPLATNMRSVRAWLDREVERDRKQHGFTDPFLTLDERRRTIITQDQGFKWERTAERVRWAAATFGTFPMWICAIGHEGSNEGSFFVDIGIYGDAANSAYRVKRDMRAWQLSADHPAVWGDMCLTKDEVPEFGSEAYQRLRRRYHAVGAFASVEDKVTFYDPKVDGDDDGDGPMVCWRQRRSWRRSRVQFLAVYVPLLAILFAILYYIRVVAGKFMRN